MAVDRRFRETLAASDGGYRVEVELHGQPYCFKVLNISQGGIGMLVMQSQSDVLPLLQGKSRIKMVHITPKGRMEIVAVLRHTSIISSGEFKGHYVVGFSITI
ncbi:MAG: hypothetical protein R6V54_04940 [Desulfobacteraceae bacterium]